MPKRHVARPDHNFEMDLSLPEQQNTKPEVFSGNYYTPYNVDMEKLKDRVSLNQFVSRVSDSSKKIIFLLTDPTTAEFIEEKLGQRFKLSENQKTEATRIIRDVLLADTYIADVPLEISKRLGVNTSTGGDIANQIISQLFASALNDIERIQRQKFPGRVSGQPPAAAAPIPGEDLPETGGNIIDLRQK